MLHAGVRPVASSSASSSPQGCAGGSHSTSSRCCGPNVGTPEWLRCAAPIPDSASSSGGRSCAAGSPPSLAVWRWRPGSPACRRRHLPHWCRLCNLDRAGFNGFSGLFAYPPIASQWPRQRHPPPPARSRWRDANSSRCLGFRLGGVDVADFLERWRSSGDFPALAFLEVPPISLGTARDRGRWLLRIGIAGGATAPRFAR